MSSSLFRLRTVLSLLGVAVLASPACVVKLADKNAPEVNGAVTGAPANCGEIKSLARGAPGGDAAIKYLGRFSFPQADPDDPTAVVAQTPEFDWSGNNITVRFQGTTKVTAMLLLPGDVPQDQMFEFVVDGKANTRQITVTKDARGAPTNTAQTNYDVTGLSSGIHELTIWKNTEPQKGTIIFQGFDLHGGTMLPPTRRPRKIEVIGDSIICGYGIEGQNATCPFEIPVRNTKTPDGKTTEIDLPVTENQYMSFTSQVARALDADITTFCWSGKGVYKNYKEDLKVDPTGALVLAPDATTTVPQLWEKRTIANDVNLEIPWDFTKETPDSLPQVVFISLGTNDFSRDTLPEHPNDPTALPGDNIPDGDMNDPVEYGKFYDTYLDFVTQVRTHRPDAHIFIATPPMLTDQFPLINSRTRCRAVLDKVVAARAAAGDSKVYAMNLVEMGFRYGLGCDYHPNLEVHAIMADQLAGAIRSKTCWN